MHMVHLIFTLAKTHLNLGGWDLSNSALNLDISLYALDTDSITNPSKAGPWFHIHIKIEKLEDRYMEFKQMRDLLNIRLRYMQLLAPSRRISNPGLAGLC